MLTLGELRFLRDRGLIESFSPILVEELERKEKLYGRIHPD